MAKTLLLLAEKAEKQEMRVEADAIKSIIPTILSGTPADQIKPSTALCDTDTDCARLEKELKKQQADDSLLKKKIAEKLAEKATLEKKIADLKRRTE